MGTAPVLHEVGTTVNSVANLIVGDPQGAAECWKKYSEKSLIVSPIIATGHNIAGNHERAKKYWKGSARAVGGLLGVSQNVPILHELAVAGESLGDLMAGEPEMVEQRWKHWSKSSVFGCAANGQGVDAIKVAGKAALEVGVFVATMGTAAIAAPLCSTVEAVVLTSVVGAEASVASTIGQNEIDGKKTEAKDIVASALGGALGGAVAGKVARVKFKAANAPGVGEMKLAALEESAEIQSQAQAPNAPGVGEMGLAALEENAEIQFQTRAANAPGVGEMGLAALEENAEIQFQTQAANAPGVGEMGLAALEEKAKIQFQTQAANAPGVGEMGLAAFEEKAKIAQIVSKHQLPIIEEWQAKLAAAGPVEMLAVTPLDLALVMKDIHVAAVQAYQAIAEGINLPADHVFGKAVNNLLKKHGKTALKKAKGQKFFRELAADFHPSPDKGHGIQINNIGRQIKNLNKKGKNQNIQFEKELYKTLANMFEAEVQ